MKRELGVCTEALLFCPREDHQGKPSVSQVAAHVPTTGIMGNSRPCFRDREKAETEVSQGFYDHNVVIFFPSFWEVNMAKANLWTSEGSLLGEIFPPALTWVCKC